MPKPGPGLVAAPQIEDSAELQAERARLKGASVGGVAVNLGSQVLRFGLRFGYQILLARLLVPSDFGLVAMIAPAIAFVQLFADLGLSQATIQMKEINQAQLSFLFWLNVAASLLLATICVLIAPWVAEFYGDPRVTSIMVASAGLLLASGFYTQHMALLNRHMRFRAIAVLDIACLALGTAAGLTAALLEAGYWAILVNQAASTFTGMAIAYGATRWVPGRPGPFQEMKPLLHFGGNITISNFLNFFSRSTDRVLIGRFEGEHALGLYDNAFKLVLLPFSQISAPFTKVALPLLSRSLDQPDFYRRAYERMLEAVLLLVYPGLVYMIAASPELIGFMLGPRWAEVVPIFAILGIDAFVAPLGNSMGWLFVSQGRTREMRNWGVVTSVLFVSCFVVGLQWGVQGVAAGYAVAGVVEISFLWRFATRTGPLRGRDFLLLVVPFLFAVAVTFAAVLGLRSALPVSLGSLALEAACAYVAFGAALAVLPRGRRILRQVSDQARGLLAKTRPKPAS